MEDVASNFQYYTPTYNLRPVLLKLSDTLILNQMSDLCNVHLYFLLKKYLCMACVLDDLKKPISVDIYPVIPF